MISAVLQVDIHEPPALLFPEAKGSTTFEMMETHMRHVILSALVASALAVGPLLATESASGVGKSIDMKARTLTLENGTVYQLPPKFQAKLTPGQTVAIAPK